MLYLQVYTFVLLLLLCVLYMCVVPLPVQDLTDFALTQALVLTFQRRLYLCYQSSQPPKINDVEQYY